jgi:EAL domain-containing protein (putative c-di-GMP-specific phosphodiesterase class I)/GGDEF domain-containing protein
VSAPVSPSSLAGIPAPILRLLAGFGAGLIAAWLAQVVLSTNVRGLTLPALWPVGALAFAFAWRYGAVWAAVPAAGAGLALILLGADWRAALAAFLGSSIGSSIGALMLARLLLWKPADYRIEATLRFIVVSLTIVAPVNASLATVLLISTEVLPWTVFASTSIGLWIADALGIMAITPLALSLLSPSGTQAPDGGRPFELVFAAIAALIAFAVTAVGQSGLSQYLTGLLFLTYPLLVAIGIRANERACAITVALSTCVILLSFRLGFGLPEIGSSADTLPRPSALLNASLILMIAATTALLLQAVSSDRRHALGRIARQARQDMSTGLLNDRGLLAELGDRLVASQRPTYGLIGIQISNFDTLNDLCGPITALQLEQSAAALLQRQPGMLLAARLSSGRYCLMVGAESVTQVRSVARDVYCQLNGQVFKADHGSLRLIVSAGGLLVDNKTPVNAEDCMLSLSDAMAIASSVRDPQLFVEPLSQTTIEARRAYQEKTEHIREAIREHRFEVYAQPIVDSDAPHGLLSYEILARLRDSAGHIMKPPEFLPLAAQAQLTVALDRGIIRSVFSWLALNPDALARTHKCSINLSGLTMSDGTAASYIREMRSQFSIPSEKIVFEITESEAIRNPGAASRLVDELRADGFSIALDDFGTGLATFEYLKRFPIDYLKIDGSFIRNLINNPIDEEIVLSTIRVAHRLNVKTVAEHVHSQEIYDRLCSLGIDHLQGDLISRPRPLADLFSDELALTNAQEVVH